MTIRSFSRAAALVVLLHSAGGCSWAFMSRPPQVVHAPNYPLECTGSRAAPVLDTICAGYFVVNGLALAAATSCNEASFGEDCVDSKAAGIALSAGLAALCTASAATGYRSANQCQTMKSMNALCITGNEAACLKLNSSWKPSAKALSGFPAVEPADPPSLRPAAAPSPQPAASPATQESAGCTKDVDCKGSRVCDRGMCVEPATGSSL